MFQQLLEVEQKRSQKTRSIQDQKRNMQRELLLLLGRRYGRSERNSKKRSAFFCQARFKFDVMCQMFFRRIKTRPAQMPGKDEVRKESEEEQEQSKASQQLVLPAPGGYNEGAPASLVEFDLARIRSAHGECGGARNVGAANDRKRTLSNPPGRERLPMDEDASL